ncbi:hypothetical protein JCGZ_08326 [Jatropha curcas]|uniref:Uncharacterized protein n=1 Tax=Jatropha curcas TaxID=180498 RepID=A0A067KXI3_JATCU|nr:hypothetical protein JCGZ_08326 [Jatropha curcas]
MHLTSQPHTTLAGLVKAATELELIRNERQARGQRIQQSSQYKRFQSATSRQTSGIHSSSKRFRGEPQMGVRPSQTVGRGIFPRSAPPTSFRDQLLRLHLLLVVEVLHGQVYQFAVSMAGDILGCVGELCELAIDVDSLNI